MHSPANPEGVTRWQPLAVACVPGPNARPYATCLEMERQLLNWERAGGHGATFKALEGTLWLDNPAGSFQGGDEPLPSTRAAVVLSAVKYGWREEALTDR